MKRSLLDPLPRQLSTQALAVLVALVVCGTGIAVARYLDSDPHDRRSTGEIHAAPAEESGNDPFRRSAPSSFSSPGSLSPPASFSPPSYRPSSGLTSTPGRGSSWGGSGCSTSSAPAALDTRGTSACAPSSTKPEAPTTFRATGADS